MNERGKVINDFLDMLHDIAVDAPEVIPKWLVGCLGLIVMDAPGASQTLLENIDNSPKLDGWQYVELLSLLNKLHNGDRDPEPAQATLIEAQPPPPPPPQQLSVRVTEHSVTKRVTEATNETTLPPQKKVPKCVSVLSQLSGDERGVHGYLIDGEFFASQTAVAKHLGVSQSWVGQKICQRESATIKGKLVEVVHEGDGPLGERGRRDEEKPARSNDDVVQVGTTRRFPAMTAAAEAVGVSTSTVKRAMKKGNPVGDDDAVLARAKDVKEWMCESCGHSIGVDPTSRTPAIRCAKCRSSAWVAVKRAATAIA